MIARTPCRCAVCVSDRVLSAVLRVLAASTGLAVLLWAANVMGRSM